MVKREDGLDRRSLLAVQETIKRFRDLSPLMPIQQADLFLTVGLHPDIELGDLTKRVGQSYSSINRNYRALGTRTRTGEPGLQLIESYEDPEDARRKRVRLTAKGELFLHRILNNFETEH